MVKHPKASDLMDKMGEHTATPERAITLQNIGCLVADICFWGDVDDSTLFEFVMIPSMQKVMHSKSSDWFGGLWAFWAGEVSEKARSAIFSDPQFVQPGGRIITMMDIIMATQ